MVDRNPHIRICLVGVCGWAESVLVMFKEICCNIRHGIKVLLEEEEKRHTSSFGHSAVVYVPNIVKRLIFVKQQT